MRFRASLLSIGVFGMGLDDGGCDCAPKPAPPPQTSFAIEVLGVPLADDDGSGAATITEAEFQTLMAGATAIFKRGGADITFTGSLDKLQKSTLMNHDCVPQTQHPELNTDPNTDPNSICDTLAPDNARNAYALRTPNKLVIMLRGYEDAAQFADGHWRINFNRAGGGYSWFSSHHVAGVGFVSDIGFYAHEMGHYLHLFHTMYLAPKSLEEAQAQTTAFVQMRKAQPQFQILRDGLGLYDNDGLADTPPDPAPDLFHAVYGDACTKEHSSIDIAIHVDGTDYVLPAKPDRANIMSYFFRCPWDTHVSQGQARVMYSSLGAERQRLLHPELLDCYAKKGLAGASDTDPSQRVAIVNACLKGASLHASSVAALSAPADPCGLPAH